MTVKLRQWFAAHGGRGHQYNAEALCLKCFAEQQLLGVQGQQKQELADVEKEIAATQQQLDKVKEQLQQHTEQEAVLARDIGDRKLRLQVHCRAGPTACVRYLCDCLIDVKYCVERNELLFSATMHM